MSAVISKCYDVGYEERFPDWNPPYCHTVPDYSLVTIARNTPESLRPLPDANSTLDPSLIQALVETNASLLGLPQQMVNQVKWYNCDSLQRRRSVNPLSYGLICTIALKLHVPHLFLRR